MLKGLNSHPPSLLLMLAAGALEGDLRNREPRQSQKRLVSCVYSRFQNSDKILARSPKIPAFRFE
jgi:hypothetical protein